MFKESISAVIAIFMCVGISLMLVACLSSSIVNDLCDCFL